MFPLGSDKTISIIVTQKKGNETPPTSINSRIETSHCRKPAFSQGFLYSYLNIPEVRHQLRFWQDPLYLVNGIQVLGVVTNDTKAS